MRQLGQVFKGILKSTALEVIGYEGTNNPTRWMGRSDGAAPTIGDFEKGDWVTDATGGSWICSVSGAPGTWLSMGGGSPLHVGPSTPAGGEVFWFDTDEPGVGGGDQTYTARQTQNAGGFNAPTTITATFGSTTLAYSTLIAVVTAYGQTVDWVFPSGWVKIGDMISFRSQVWGYVNAPAVASLTVSSETGATHSQLAVVEYTTTVPSGHLLDYVGYLEHVGGGTSTLTADRATGAAGLVLVAHKSGGAAALPTGYTTVLSNTAYDGIFLYSKVTTYGETSTAAVGSGQNVMIYADPELGRLKLLVNADQAAAAGIAEGWRYA